MTNKSKSLLLTLLVLGCFTLTGFGQKALDSKYFNGYWMSNGTSTRCVIFRDTNNYFQMAIWDTTDGTEVYVTKIETLYDVIKTSEFYKPNNWNTENTYTIVNENEIKDSIGGAANGVIIYFKRIK
jgi:hypothetical protein